MNFLCHRWTLVCRGYRQPGNGQIAPGQVLPRTVWKYLAPLIGTPLFGWGHKSKRQPNPATIGPHPRCKGYSIYPKSRQTGRKPSSVGSTPLLTMWKTQLRF